MLPQGTGEVLVLPEEHTARGGFSYSPTLFPGLQLKLFGVQEALQLLKGCRGAAQKLFYSQLIMPGRVCPSQRSEVNCSCHSGQVEISPGQGEEVS